MAIDLYPDCHLLTNEYLKWDEDLNILIPFRRYTFEYLNNGKKVINTYERYQESTAEWDLTYTIEQDFDDEGRELRNFKESFFPTYIDTILTVTAYTPKGERHTYRRFQTSIIITTILYTKLDSIVLVII